MQIENQFKKLKQHLSIEKHDLIRRELYLCQFLREIESETELEIIETGVCQSLHLLNKEDLTYRKFIIGINQECIKQFSWYKNLIEQCVISDL